MLQARPLRLIPASMSLPIPIARDVLTFGGLLPDSRLDFKVRPCIPNEGRNQFVRFFPESRSLTRPALEFMKARSSRFLLPNADSHACACTPQIRSIQMLQGQFRRVTICRTRVDTFVCARCGVSRMPVQAFASYAGICKLRTIPGNSNPVDTLVAHYSLRPIHELVFSVAFGRAGVYVQPLSQVERSARSHFSTF